MRARITPNTDTFYAVMGELIMSVLKEPSSDALLEKCLHRHTQNSNESLNGLIWNKYPKLRK